MDIKSLQDAIDSLLVRVGALESDLDDVFFALEYQDQESVIEWLKTAPSPSNAIN